MIFLIDYNRKLFVSHKRLHRVNSVADSKREFHWHRSACLVALCVWKQFEDSPVLYAKVGCMAADVPMSIACVDEQDVISIW